MYGLPSLVCDLRGNRDLVPPASGTGVPNPKNTMKLTTMTVVRWSAISATPCSNACAPSTASRLAIVTIDARPANERWLRRCKEQGG